MMTLEKNWTNEYIDISFLKRGRDRNGLDCYGLVRLVYKEKFDIFLPSYDDRYENMDQREELQEIIYEDINSDKWLSIKKGKEQSGDIIVLRIVGYNMHVGVVVGRGIMLHIHKGIDTCLECYHGLMWSKRVMGFYRYDDFTN